MGNEGIASVADIKGVNMRIGGLNAKSLQALGAVPTMVMAPEGYQALERGTIDSFGMPYAYAFGAYKMHEVSKFVTDGMAMSGLVCFEGVSLPAWNKLPDGRAAAGAGARQSRAAQGVQAGRREVDSDLQAEARSGAVPGGRACQARGCRQRYLGGLGLRSWTQH
jgi:TRAP-type mannitol/chloroaromatic compound transport system substrate-binding protein